MDGAVTPPGRVSAYRWVVMGIWLLSSVTGYLAVNVLGILLPGISSELDLSPGQQGILGSAAFWGNLALTLPLSWWTSRHGPKALSTVTLALGSLFLFIQGWAPAFAVLLAGRLAFGVTVTAREPARALLISQWFSKREVIIVNSFSNVLFGLVLGSGLAATPFILRAVGDDWRTVLRIFAVLLVALTVSWAVFGREKPRPDRQSVGMLWDTGVLRGALRHRDLWIGSLGFFGPILVWTTFLSFYPTLMLETYDTPLYLSGAILALSTVVGGFSGLGVVRVVRGAGRGRSILQGFGIVMTGSYIGLVLSPSVPLLVGLAVLNGITWGIFPYLYSVPFHLRGIQPREVAIALAGMLTIMSTGVVLGPLVTGFLQEALGDLKSAMFIISFMCLTLTVAGSVLRVEPGAIRAEGQEPVGA